MNVRYGQSTTYPKTKEVAKRWIIVDAKDKILGRLASEVAKRLMGKHNPIYHPAVTTGDRVIIINADKIKLTGQKAETKEFIWHTGYAGHLQRRPFLKQMALSPAKAFELTIRGMLPKNKLGKQMLKNLRVFAGENHNLESQKPESVSLL
ncbi:MAG: 50S ribosomal protein L13 [Leptospiraceae bacterium]|nr:50S ribosomal protein L13 [Leptospiraceae bacterium]MCB1199210.1 50S ribosomal protein L13 [Leptospiraceae bacterium]